MNKKIIIGVIVAALVLVGGFFLFSQSDSGGSDAGSTTETSEQNVVTEDMSQIPTDLDEALAKAMERQGEEGVYVIDVRTPQEWELGHAKDAMSWDLNLIAISQMPPVDKNAEIYVYCNSGNRATQAIIIMQQEGFTNMTNIRGYDDWVAAGGATETGL